MVRYKFTNISDHEFATVLKGRVKEYFKKNEIGQDANHQMITKSVVVVLVYLIPYFIMLSGFVETLAIYYLLWVVMGLSKAVIGTSVMHDALHGSYSQNRLVNNFVSFSAMIIGADPTVWKIQHNVLHHTYTNIEHADEDIQPRFVMRFTPHQERRWFHRFQHVYASFFYSISTLVWVTFKDFFKSFHYRNMGLIKSGKSFNEHMAKLVLRKVFYHMVFLVTPLLVFPFAPITTISMFVIMHLVAGLSLSLVFQTAHVMPDMKFIDQKEEEISENWTVHQLLTTSNYASTNKTLTWLVGSLNHQIEHHLFPNICHIHYPKLAPIVKATALEYGIPYHEHRTFSGAVLKHFSMLRKLGRMDEIVDSNDPESEVNEAKQLY
jgi:linoleoyl-CoA desaturase